MLGAAKHVVPTDMPASRTVVRYEFHGIPKTKPSPRYWWWVINRPDIDVCLKDYGFDINVVIRAEIAAFVNLFLGHLGLRQALEKRQVAFEGAGDAVTAVCQMLGFPQEPAPRVFTFPSVSSMEWTAPGSELDNSEHLPPIPRVSFQVRSEHRD
jgi:hypothetical protein